MSEGLHPDDFEQINQLIEDLKRKRKISDKQSRFVQCSVGDLKPAFFSRGAFSTEY